MTLALPTSVVTEEEASRWRAWKGGPRPQLAAVSAHSPYLNTPIHMELLTGNEIVVSLFSRTSIKSIAAHTLTYTKITISGTVRSAAATCWNVSAACREISSRAGNWARANSSPAKTAAVSWGALLPGQSGFWLPQHNLWDLYTSIHSLPVRDPTAGQAPWQLQCTVPIYGMLRWLAGQDTISHCF